MGSMAVLGCLVLVSSVIGAWAMGFLSSSQRMAPAPSPVPLGKQKTAIRKERHPTLAPSISHETADPGKGLRGSQPAPAPAPAAVPEEKEQETEEKEEKS